MCARDDGTYLGVREIERDEPTALTGRALCASASSSEGLTTASRRWPRLGDGLRMKPNDQIETLIKALNDAQNDARIWQSAYDSSAEKRKRLENEVKQLNGELDELRQNAKLAGGEADE